MSLTLSVGSGLAMAVKSNRHLDVVARYNPVYYRRALRAATTDASDASQESLVSRALARAGRTAYGARYAGRPFAGWPILRKAQLRADESAFRGNAWPAMEATTGGSTGVPLRIWRSLENVAAEQAFLDSLLISHGFRFFSARIAVLRGDNVKDPSDQRPPYGLVRGRRLLLSAPHLYAGSVAWFADAIDRFRPDVLWIYPTGGDYLASLCIAAGIRLQVPVVLSSSEVLAPDARARLSDGLGGEVIDYYGQAERVCFAHQRRADEAWFAPLYGKVELQDVAMETEPGTRAAAIIGTCFWNAAMPLVRYDTGDLALVPATYSDADVRAVERGTKPFLRILGRQSEYVVTPEGKRIQALNHIPRGVRALRVQLIQEAPDRLEIRALPAPGFDADDEQLLLRNARLKVPDSVAIKIVSDQPLLRTTSQKTPFVVRRC